MGMRLSSLLAGLPAPRAGGGEQTTLSGASEDKPRLSLRLAGLPAPRAASNEQVSVKDDKPEIAIPSVSLPPQPQDSNERDSTKSEPSMEDKPAITGAVSASLPASVPPGSEPDLADPKEEKLQATGLLVTSSSAPVSNEKVEPPRMTSWTISTRMSLPDKVEVTHSPLSDIPPQWMALLVRLCFFVVAATISCMMAPLAQET